MRGILRRLLVALPIAFIATAGLYYFGYLHFFDTHTDLIKLPIPVKETPFQLRRVICDCGIIEHFPDRPPEAPNEPIPIGDDFTFREATIETPSRNIDLPKISLETSENGVYGTRNPPSYPKACIKKSASGAVVVEFDVTPEGTVTNARIIQSPDRCFNSEVLRFASTFRYRPQADASGRSAWRRGVRETFNFELAE